MQLGELSAGGLTCITLKNPVNIPVDGNGLFIQMKRADDSFGRNPLGNILLLLEATVTLTGHPGQIQDIDRYAYAPDCI